MVSNYLYYTEYNDNWVSFVAMQLKKNVLKVYFFIYRYYVLLG